MSNTIIIRALFAFLVVLAVPSYSIAATLGLTTSTPTLSASSGSVDYLEFGADGDLSAFAAPVNFLDGLVPDGATTIGFGIGFSLAAPTIGATGGFDVFDENGLFLGGDLVAVGFSNNSVELQFNNLIGSGVAGFGPSALMVLAFADVLGANPFDSFLDGQAYDASITVSNVAPVPLPAAWPLILFGLFGFRLITGRRRNNQ